MKIETNSLRYYELIISKQRICPSAQIIKILNNIYEIAVLRYWVSSNQDNYL